MSSERLEILKMVEAGQIDASQAAELLAAIDRAVQDTRLDVQAPRPGAPDLAGIKWAKFWTYPLMIGGGVLILGSLITGLVYATKAARGWLVCGWLPMILGLLGMLVAWWTRRAKWLHLRISEGGKRKMAFSFPLPLTLAAWGLRIAQPFVPQLQETGVDDLIIALRDGVPGEEPLFIDVQDDEDGEHVEIYIG